MGLDGLEQQIVDLARHRHGRRRIERLAAGLIVRQHLQVDAGRIHGGEPRVAEVEQFRDHVEAEQLLAIVAAMRAGRKVLLLPRQDEVLFERDDSQSILRCHPRA